MTLIQKLPLGLALAACMVMSSCSQEDVQVAGPMAEQSALSPDPNRGIPIGPEPSFPTTNSILGINNLPLGWKAPKDPSEPQQQSPLDPPGEAGTSSLTHLWGNPSMPLIKPLPLPVPNASSVATFMIRENYNQNIVTKPIVATLKNLIPGKKYSVKIYGATAFSPFTANQNEEYGRGISIEILNAAVGSSAFIDLSQKQAEWGSATLIFTAGADEVKVKCSGFLDDEYVQSHAEFEHYLHVYTDQNSIKELL